MPYRDEEVIGAGIGVNAPCVCWNVLPAAQLKGSSVRWKGRLPRGTVRTPTNPPVPRDTVTYGVLNGSRRYGNSADGEEGSQKHAHPANSTFIQPPVQRTSSSRRETGSRAAGNRNRKNAQQMRMVRGARRFIGEIKALTFNQEPEPNPWQKTAEEPRGRVGMSTCRRD